MANLLLVDDDPISLKFLLAYLKTTEHELFSAHDGQEALDMINAKPAQFFSCIITDYLMPKMDGLELTRLLKEDKTRQIIPIIMQTSASSEAEIQRGLEAGVFYYLLKPYTKDTLLSTIGAALKDFKNHSEALNRLEQFSASLNMLKNAYFELKTVKQAKHLSNFIAYLTDDPIQIGVGLFELMMNAIEHGNLGITYDEKTDYINRGVLPQEIERRLEDDRYKNKFVRVIVQTTINEIKVHISDMGAGFNFEDYLEFSVERAMDNHGRGIMMANKLSFDGLYYSNGGTSVTAIKNLNHNQATHNEDSPVD